MQKSIIFLLLTCFFVQPLKAQYFGRNKPHYQKMDFQVHQTPHFELYDYLENPGLLEELSNSAEAWYSMHQSVLKDTFKQKNPLIIYNDHAGFQQTNTIRGGVSVGTGGVTEGFRNRVVFPVAMTKQQTHHVLGHELVHAFQYHMVLQGDSTSIRNMGNLPLWMVEGLAEYLSIGRIDAHTALWMRDAVISDNLPRIKDLSNGEYFPYRWGQSFWAFVTGVYGDDVIRPLFMNTAKYGLDMAIRLTLNTTQDALSEAWQETLRSHYGVWVTKGEKERLPGKRLLSDENAGKMNICPVVSPNGKYLIFLSEKNLFTTDLYLADAQRGKILKKVSSSVRDGHIDQYNFIESAGTWSPDSKKFAFDVYEKGRSVLIIKDALKGKTLEKFPIKGVQSFSNPAWSPDGKTIVVSGLVNGQVDLYSVNLRTKKVEQLTNSVYSEILPSWSSDGSFLTFSTDQISLERGRFEGAYKMNLAVMDIVSKEITQYDLFPGADNLNPQFDSEGRLLFVSDRDGFRNLYRYDFASKKLYQLTELKTGITGITPYSPAFAVAEDRDRIVYTYYQDGEYNIYSARDNMFEPKEVDVNAVDKLPATLPPFDPRNRDLVNTNLRVMDATTAEAASETTLNRVPFKTKFSLDYIGGSAGVGVATGNSSFGTTSGLAGGIDMLFGDMLGNHQIYSGIAINGDIKDAAGQFSYINQKNRINWGINLSHIPFSSGQYSPDFTPGIDTTLNGTPFTGFKDELYVQRVFQERIGAFTFYPISTTQRFEVGGAYEFYWQRLDRYLYYYDLSGFLLGQEQERLASGAENLKIASINAAFVGDNSYFGMTAPLAGHRYRISMEKFFGDYNFNALLVDARKYFWFKPVGLGFRGLSYSRFGGNSNNTDQVFPLFAAQPFYVRGYTSDVLYNQQPELFEQMTGSKLAVFNAELRMPLTGPKGLALFKFRFLPTDLNLFFDMGMGWFQNTDFQKDDPDPNDNIIHVQHKPLMSTGVSIRANLFGVMVLEPYWALPLNVDKERRSWVFGLNIVPGW
jgi:Tol biopolymer transport system component